MSYNNYKNIRKYAAFIFMFFTVLSGSSDRIDSENIARLGRKALIDIIITNKLMLQDVKLSSGHLTNKSKADNQGFREFLDIVAGNPGMENIIVFVSALVLLVICINYLLLQKNIWKNAVF